MNDLLEGWKNDKTLGHLFNEEKIGEVDIPIEDVSSTAVAQEYVNKEWKRIRHRACEEGKVAGDNNGLRELDENGKTWVYAMPGNEFWDGEDWMYLKEDSLEDVSKIHYTSDNPLETAYMASIFQAGMRNNEIPYNLKVDALGKYDFDRNGGKHASILYVDRENLDQALNSSDAMRRRRGLPESDHYKEIIDPETYEREKGFVVREE